MNSTMNTSSPSQSSLVSKPAAKAVTQHQSHHWINTRRIVREWIAGILIVATFAALVWSYFQNNVATFKLSTACIGVSLIAFALEVYMPAKNPISRLIATFLIFGSGAALALTLGVFSVNGPLRNKNIKVILNGQPLFNNEFSWVNPLKDKVELVPAILSIPQHSAITGAAQYNGEDPPEPFWVTGVTKDNVGVSAALEVDLRRADNPYDWAPVSAFEQDLRAALIGRFSESVARLTRQNLVQANMLIAADIAESKIPLPKAVVLNGGIKVKDLHVVKVINE